MFTQYIYLNNDRHPPVPHYFEDYEGLVQFLLADRLRQSDRPIIILIRYDGINRYYRYDQLDELLDSRRMNRQKGNTAHVQTIDAVVARIAECLPGAYDRPRIPNTWIPNEACYAVMEGRVIQFEDFDCNVLGELRPAAMEYDRTMAEIRAHWKLINSGDEDDLLTYKTDAAWTG